jgi:hypothetical protein
MPRPFASRRLAALVLAWFALVVGLAAAAPWMQPAGLADVCTAATPGDPASAPGDSGGSLPRHALDCPFCLPAHAPPPSLDALVVPPAPVVHEAARTSVRAARPATRSAAPLPARGPPAFL